MSPFPQTIRSRVRRIAAAGLLLLCAATGTKCVTVYQPLVSLQRPVAIDSQVANFDGLKLLVRCVPGGALDPGDAERLCRQVTALFRRQGATVLYVVPAPGRSGIEEGGDKPELILDLRARLLHQDSAFRLESLALPLLCIASFTLIPAVSEMSMAQDVSVRGPDGFLLASDSLQARFVQYAGVGIWGVNLILDYTVRPDEEEVTGNKADQEFSRDFYAQLSQLVFNAKMRARVLQGFEPQAPPDPPKATN